MPDFTRYALFYAPEAESPLANFAASWLGWDPAAGRRLDHPEVPGLTALDIHGVTERPRKYGFHGTLRPPFALGDDRMRADVEAAVARVAERAAPFEIPALGLARLGTFLALVPEAPVAALSHLAGLCVHETNPLRAPLGPGDLARRRASGLTPGQETMLQRWGYPYVFEEFRFHLTLTGKLAEAQADAIETALEKPLSDLIGKPEPVTHVSLFAEAADGRFHILKRFPLKG